MAKTNKINWSIRDTLTLETTVDVLIDKGCDIVSIVILEYGSDTNNLAISTLYPIRAFILVK